MRNLGINPLLIEVLTGKHLTDIPTEPSISDLPGTYPALVAKNIKRIIPPFESNSQTMICKSCGKKAKYDLGHLTINLQKYRLKKNDMDEAFQVTGYFRCKQCNAAGNWEISNEFRFMLLTATMMVASNVKDNRFSVGENQLFDGSSHNYATDAEEHLLNKIIQSTGDSYLWNRLGNLYYKAGRADLGACAFEHSITLNPMQTESHFSLGMIFSQIGDHKLATNHFYRMLISSSNYKNMNILDLRDLLSNGIRELIYLCETVEGEVSISPPLELYEEMNISTHDKDEHSVGVIEGILNAEDLSSFYPLAEIYLGERRNELPSRKVYFTKKKKKKKRK